MFVVYFSSDLSLRGRVLGEMAFQHDGLPINVSSMIDPIQARSFQSNIFYLSAPQRPTLISIDHLRNMQRFYEKRNPCHVQAYGCG